MRAGGGRTTDSSDFFSRHPRSRGRGGRVLYVRRRPQNLDLYLSMFEQSMTCPEETNYPFCFVSMPRRSWIRKRRRLLPPPVSAYQEVEDRPTRLLGPPPQPRKYYYHHGTYWRYQVLLLCYYNIYEYYDLAGLVLSTKTTPRKITSRAAEEYSHNNITYYELRADTNSTST
jgi:hypothetical protein